MGAVVYTAIGLVLAAWVFLLALCWAVVGEVRGGLEVWAEVTMKIVSLGRWNAPQEEAE